MKFCTPAWLVSTKIEMQASPYHDKMPTTGGIKSDQEKNTNILNYSEKNA